MNIRQFLLAIAGIIFLTFYRLGGFYSAGAPMPGTRRTCVVLALLAFVCVAIEPRVRQLRRRR
jgi:hypothetical protein